VPKLDPGAKVDLTYKATMGKKALTSSAKITYKADGSTEEKTHTVEEKKIPFAETNLSATLSSNTKGVVAGGTLTLTLELKNKGNADMSDVRVTDAVLGDVFTNQKVDAGKTITLEKEITLTETSEYQFVVTAIDATGTEVSAASNTLSVTAMNPDDALHLTLTAVPDRTEVYNDPAGVRFTVTITNDSKVDASNVKISHGYVDLYTFESIKAGESRTMSRDTVLSTSGKFQFTATAQDPLENTSTFQSNEMQIAVYEPTPVPATPTPPPVPTPEPTFVPATWAPIHHESIGTIPKMIQKFLLPALIVAGILLVASSGLLFVAAKKRIESKKASDAAYDHLERARRRDYTVVNPEEMAAASKATLSQHRPQDNRDPDLIATDDTDWDLPPVESLTQPSEPDEIQTESYSSFGQGFYGEIGDEGFETEPYQQPEEYPMQEEIPAEEEVQEYSEQSYSEAPAEAYPEAGYDPMGAYDQQAGFDYSEDHSYGYQQDIPTYGETEDFDLQSYGQTDGYQPYDYAQDGQYGYDQYDQSSYDQPESMGDDRMSYDAQDGYMGQYDGFDDYQTSYDGYQQMDGQTTDPYYSEQPDPDAGGEQPRSRRSRK